MLWPPRHGDPGSDRCGWVAPEMAYNSKTKKVKKKLKTPSNSAYKVLSRCVFSFKYLEN